ncbi:alpha-L-arabinofuranosidase C-terminal domain-containing protein [Sphingobacterium bovistauri]|uniref:non-reducing end alpha-L-arabinofuranosidase n=1 Tax=Sphingobacterium bovistauri TaxID=2781959 RepID=A0ABS7Z0X3_9SPHI|nr:alpha-L-arabinofuranosidase C-terminal domain-containing protein [Sphingobacterium bovistauri]MCA5003808.1 carbohydrate binding domain-containing protein [Sphingobacterium bovistauri]
MKLKQYIVLAALAMQSIQFSHAQQKSLVVDVNTSTAKVDPNMWGVFFEDINMGADGGIYAELIKNRSFEFFRPMMGWKNLGAVREGNYLILNRQLNSEANPRYLRVLKESTDKQPIGLRNEGFRGMGVKQGNTYEFSLWYRQKSPGITVRVELVDSQGAVIGKSELKPSQNNNQWQYQEVSFTSSKTDHKATLQVWFDGDGSIDLDMISLFPTDTWKGRKKGLRADMVQTLADLKPGFIRFPGGCIVEGFDLSQRFQWKKTVGPIESRQLIVNRWNTEFAHRLTPDYFQTSGLGFYEYFLLAEDLGAEPLPILNCGMACQFNTGEVVPLDQLDEYVQDALDLIEFANGSVNSTWGKLRADMGHPAPFNLKMLGVGNENWGPQYVERLKVFQDALKKYHPEIKIIASSGTDPEGARFDYLDKELRAMNIDIIDEHFYRNPEWFLSNAKRYDKYDRTGPKIFAGEYASHSKNNKKPEYRNNWEAALSEAAFLTGVERNADVVQLASYAPLFAHIDGWQWTPDLIWVDNLNVFVTPSYHVQKMYSTNKGTDVVPLLRDGKMLAGEDNLYGSAVVDKNTKELVLKIINTGESQEILNIDLKGIKKSSGEAEVSVLQHDDPLAHNEVGQAPSVSPINSKVNYKGKKLPYTLKAKSVNLIKIKL